MVYTLFRQSFLSTEKGNQLENKPLNIKLSSVFALVLYHYTKFITTEENISKMKSRYSVAMHTSDLLFASE